MVLDVGRKALVLGVCLAGLCRISLGVERICLKVARQASYFAITATVTVQVPHLRIEDPHEQLNHAEPLPIALGDVLTSERLKAVHRSLEAENERIKIVVDEWNTWILRYSEHPERFTEEEKADPARITLILQHPLDESPDLMVQGIITQLLFDRLRYMKGNFQRAFDEGTKNLIESVHAAAARSPELRARLMTLTEEQLAWQIHETVKLRCAWVLKVRFYTEYLASHPRLRDSRLPQPEDRAMDRLARLEPQNDGKFDLELFKEFVAFYSKNESQHLDPEIVSAVWGVPLAGLWEISMIMPDLLQPR